MGKMDGKKFLFQKIILSINLEGLIKEIIIINSKLVWKKKLEGSARPRDVP